jgi:hypothetical protein
MGLLHFPPDEWTGLLGSSIGRLPPEGATAPLFGPPAAVAEPNLVAARYGFGSSAFPRPGFTPVPPGIFDEWRRHAERGLTGLFDWYSRATNNTGGGSGENNEPDCRVEWEKARDRCESEIPIRYRYNKGVTGGYQDIENCARGLVSERCGGNRY